MLLESLWPKAALSVERTSGLDGVKPAFEVWMALSMEGTSLAASGPGRGKRKGPVARPLPLGEQIAQAVTALALSANSSMRSKFM